MIKKGMLCVINPNIETGALKKKERNVLNSVIASSPQYLFVMRSIDDENYLVTMVYDSEKKNSYHKVVEGTDLWFRCIEFVSVKGEVLFDSFVRIENSYELVSKIYEMREEIKKQQYVKNKHRARKKQEKKELMRLLDRTGVNKVNNKYPYGSGIAKHAAPGKSIRVVHGGGVSPR